MPKKWSLGTTGKSYEEKVVCLDSVGQNIWKYITKSSKTGKGHKNLIYGFAYISTTIVKALLLERRLCIRHYVSTLIWDLSDTS